ncbi:MAG TPA: helix-turn-helix domain-containing protein, partial [Geobacteraceae bacterium]|nr:helix-turn-helix domain-containing protein [Geobacteraceae bacterium]
MDNNADFSSVGNWLRGVRESRGESLDDVARVTRIGKGYLEAIELGEMHKLPSEAYTRGFVRLYATHLGLSGDEAVARLQGRGEPSTVTQGSEEPPIANSDEPGIRAVNGTYRRWAIPLTLFIFLLIFAIVSRVKNNGVVPATPVPVASSQQVPSATQAPAATVPQGEQVRPAVPADSTEPAPLPAETAQPEGIILRLKAVQTGKL